MRAKIVEVQYVFYLSQIQNIDIYTTYINMFIYIFIKNMETLTVSEVSDIIKTIFDQI